MNALCHIDGRPGPILPGDHVTIKGMRCHGMVLADGVKPTVLWTRPDGAIFICADDTNRLQELVDQEGIVISDEHFYVSDTVYVTASIVIRDCKITMLGPLNKPVINVSNAGHMTYIRSNYIEYIFE